MLRNTANRGSSFSAPLRRRTLLIFVAALLLKPCLAQQKEVSPSCTVKYENHNQTDYGSLTVQHVKGTVTDPDQGAVPNACVGIFTEKGHNLLAATRSDAKGMFSLQSVAPGRYRLIIKADPLCAANVLLHVVKRRNRSQVLRVHMKPRGLDSCSYVDLGSDSAASSSPSSQMRTESCIGRKKEVVHRRSLSDVYENSTS